MMIQHSLQLLQELSRLEEEIQKMERLMEMLGIEKQEEILKKMICQTVQKKAGQSIKTGRYKN